MAITNQSRQYLEETLKQARIAEANMLETLARGESLNIATVIAASNFTIGTSIGLKLIRDTFGEDELLTKLEAVIQRVEVLISTNR